VEVSAKNLGQLFGNLTWRPDPQTGEKQVALIQHKLTGIKAAAEAMEGLLTRK